MRLSYPAAVTHHLPTPSSFTGARRLRQSLAAALLLAAGTVALPAAAQLNSNYTTASFSNAGKQNWVPLGAGSIDLTATLAAEPGGLDDSNTGELNLGFSFPFIGGSFSKVIVNTNGYVKIGAAGMVMPTEFLYGSAPGQVTPNSALTSTGPNNVNLITPFNHDFDGALDPASGVTIGSPQATYRIFSSVDSAVIEWRDVHDFDYGAATTRTQFAQMSFQLKLFPSGLIRFVYGPYLANALAPDAIKLAGAGLKGLGVGTDNVIALSKTSASFWNTTVAQNNTTGNQLNFRKTRLPTDHLVAGKAAVYSFNPIAAGNNNNVSVIVYALGKTARLTSLPEQVRARVYNLTNADVVAGTSVTLTVTGANSPAPFVVAAPLIPANGSVIINFPYSPANLGTETLTVTLPNDQGGNLITDAGNSNAYVRVVTDLDLAYGTPSVVNAGGVGFNVTTPPAGQSLANFRGEFIARFNTTSARILDQAQVDFQAANITRGQVPYQVLIFSSSSVTPGVGVPASILYTSPVYNTPILAGTALVPVLPGLAVNGDFFVGVRQIGPDNVGFSYEAENPIRNSSFFYRSYYAAVPPPTSGVGSTAFLDFETAGSPFRFAIAVTLQPAIIPVPNCAVLNTPVDGAASAPQVGSITFSSGGGSPSGFNIYLSQVQADVLGDVSAALVASNYQTTVYNYSLPGGGTYYYKIVAINASGQAGGSPSSCTVRSFTTAPNAPGNDLCAGATALGLQPNGACVPTNGTTLGATKDAIVAPTCAGLAIVDVWYTFNSGNNRNLLFSIVKGTAANIGAQLYTTCGSAALTCVADATVAGFGFSGLTQNTAYRLRIFTNTANAPGTLGTFTICASLPPDLLVNSGNSPYTTGGAYNNITVAADGVLNASANLSANYVTVSDAGTLAVSGFTLTSNIFDLQAGGTLGVTSTDGITALGSPTQNLGSVRASQIRLYSNDAIYLYENATNGITGSGLPSIVRTLGTATATAAGLNLTNPLVITKTFSQGAGTLAVGGAGRSARLRMASINGNSAFVVFNSISPGGITGVVAVDRSISGSLFSGNGYRHLASPVTTTIGDLRTGAFSPSPNVLYNNPVTRASLPGQNYPNIFGYNEGLPNTGVTFEEGWFSPTDTSAALTRGKGVTVRMYAYNTPNFVGTISHAPVGMTGLTSTGSGWHLLGNPFDFPLNWTSLTKPTGMDAGMSIFKSSGFNSGSYVPEVNGMPSSINNVIPVGQAFFAHVSSGPVTFTFNRSAATTTDRVLNRATSDTRAALTLSLAKVGEPLNEDQATVYFQDGADAAFNGQFDALKQYAAGTTPSIYTRALGTAVAINGLPLLTTSDEIVPLSADIKVAGSYTLTVVDQRYFNGTRVFLADALTGTEQELSAGQKYTFTAAAFERTPRFTLHFRPGGVTGLTANALAKHLNVYPNPVSGQPLRVELGGLSATTYAVSARLVNALGQVILTKSLTVSNGSATADLNVTTLARGLYTLQILAGAETTSRTVVVE